MGYIRHNAIIATAWQDGAADALLAFAGEIGASAVTGPKVVNSYQTVVITPDGSKDGWGASDEGDERRKQIREWLGSGKFYWEWCEVAYGNDDASAEIVESEWGGP